MAVKTSRGGKYSKKENINKPYEPKGREESSYDVMVTSFTENNKTYYALMTVSNNELVASAPNHWSDPALAVKWAKKHNMNVI